MTSPATRSVAEAQRHLEEQLLSTPLTDAVEMAEATWGPMEIWPADTRPDALAAAASLLADGHTRDPTIGYLTGRAEAERRTTLLSALAHQQGDHLCRGAPHHVLRNLLVALRITVAQTLHYPSPKHIPALSYTFGLQPLPPRTRLTTRPLTDDEAALLRLVAELDSMHNTAPGPALTALGLSGLPTVEATKVTADAMAGALLHAPGCYGVVARTLELEPWNARILTEASQRHVSVYAASIPLAYHGRDLRHPKNANASAAGVYDRMMKRVGLAAADVTPASVGLWRPMHLLQQTGDLARAVYVSGRSLERLLGLLHLSIDQSESYTGRSNIVDSNGTLIASVPNWQVSPHPRNSRAQTNAAAS